MSKSIKDSNYETEILKKFIFEVGLTKSNGLNRVKYLEAYINRCKETSNDFIRPFSINYHLDISVAKYVNIKNLNINIIKPNLDITTYSDFLSGLIENIHKFDVAVKKSNCVLFENMLKNYDKRVEYESIPREVNDDYDSVISCVSSYSFTDFIKIVSKSPKDSPFIGEDIVNIFIAGGSYSFLNEKMEDIIFNNIYPFVLYCQSNHFSVLNVFGLGHSDFIDPINLLADFSYNTPDGAGGRLLKDLMINSRNRDGLSHFIIKKPKITLKYL